MTATKAELRAGLGAARRTMPDDVREESRASIRARVLERAERERWRCVAAYEPMRTEPGSVELLAGLVALGARVLVPVTLPDRDLDWVEWGVDSGQRQPLGLDAIAAAGAVIVPASAVARDGTRLGRGGGSYDRALRRCAPDAVRVALLFDDELVDELPRDEWDEPVDAVARPAGWTDLAHRTRA